MKPRIRISALILLLLSLSTPLMAQETVAPSAPEQPAPPVIHDDWAPTTFKAAYNSFWLTPEFHVSILNDVRDRSLAGDTFGYGLRAGYRWENWSVFVQVEQNMWRAMELEHKVDQGALNIAVGAEISYLGGYVRSSLAMGPSVLMFETLLDDPGEVGVFLDFRPVGLRWPITTWFGIAADPISFAVVAPVLDAIPLVMVEYRTTLGFEFYL